jgi:hypothetical protein
MRHVATLAVGDDQESRIVRCGHHPLERRPAGRAEALEAGELRLDGDAGGGGGRDQRQAVGRNRVGVVPGRVEAEADLAAALIDERRKPVGKGRRSRLPPLLRRLSGFGQGALSRP